MDLIKKLVALLPSEDILLSELSTVISSDQILRLIFEKITQIQDSPVDFGYLEGVLDVSLETIHDHMHMGEWHAVDVKLRKSYSVASFFKVKILELKFKFNFK